MAGQPDSIAIPRAILLNVGTRESGIEPCEIEDLVGYVVSDDPGFGGSGVKGASVLRGPLDSCFTLVVIVLL